MKNIFWYNQCMTKKQLLRHLAKDVYCRLGVSKIQGIGVFAIRDIPKGTDPFVGSFRLSYVSISDDELKKNHPEVKKMLGAFFIKEKGKVLVPKCGLNGMDISFYLNHSDQPNIIADLEKDRFIAMRDIRAGKELTTDYNLYYNEDDSRFAEYVLSNR